MGTYRLTAPAGSLADHLVEGHRAISESYKSEDCTQDVVRYGPVLLAIMRTNLLHRRCIRLSRAGVIRCIAGKVEGISLELRSGILAEET